MTSHTIKQKVGAALDSLYQEDQFLFDEGLCERCVNHQFAKHLETQGWGAGYFVDCEYNKSHQHNTTGMKRVSNQNGNYIDIVVTKRDKQPGTALVCFETKLGSNYRDRQKDRQNLKILTDGIHFGYAFGVYVIFGLTRDKVKIEYYQNGNRYE